MRSTFLAALLAALLAFGLANPTFAADRPVGPETGQARTASENVGPTDPDGVDGRPWWTSPGIAPLSENDQRELAITWGQWWDGWFRLFGCGLSMCY